MCVLLPLFARFVQALLRLLNILHLLINRLIELAEKQAVVLQLPGTRTLLAYSTEPVFIFLLELPQLVELLLLLQLPLQIEL